MAPIVVTRTLHINAHRSAVWAALTEAELISEWFGDEATIDLRVDRWSNPRGGWQSELDELREFLEKQDSL